MSIANITKENIYRVGVFLKPSPDGAFVDTKPQLQYPCWYCEYYINPGEDPVFAVVNQSDIYNLQKLMKVQNPNGTLIARRKGSPSDIYGIEIYNQN